MPANSSSLLRDFLARFRRGEIGPERYHAYTTQFDRIVDAADLPLILGELSSEDAASFDQAWAAMQHALQPWRIPLLINAAGTAARIRAAIGLEQRQRIAITLLVDQSGSMRGQRILYTAAAVDLVQECLASLKMQVEVLGFTTTEWRGGQARKIWSSRGRPARPGRLNDLLHIIYRRSDDTRASAAGFALRPMLRPDMPKENIDGEALQWAASRLAEQDADRRLLIILSDGAPVDDSTLDANGPNYLMDHLQEVIAAISVEGQIELGAIGVGFDISRLYANAAFAEGADELGGVLLDFAEAMVLGR